MADATDPTGLPDAAAMAAIANAFFKAVPGGTGALPGWLAAAPEKPETSKPETSVPHLPPLAGPGFAPPSFPAPYTPAATHVVPTAPMPSPFGTLPMAADANQISVADQNRQSTSTLYVANGEDRRMPSILKPIPALDAGLPQGDELKALLSGGSSLSPRAGAIPATAEVRPYFLDQRTPAEPRASIESPGLDAGLVRRQFPILNERVNGKPLVWLDNAATTQKPQAVIDRLTYYYEHENSNIHRAAHTLAGRATDAYENAREEVRRFINAASSDEIIFTRGTTEAINLVAATWGRANIGKDDEIVITWLEHHANIVPWKRLADETGAHLRVVPVDDNGDVLIEEYAKLLGDRTKIVSFTQVSNALGTVTPAQLMVEMAHAVGAKVLVDGAQSVSHLRTDVTLLNADWFVLSGHKIYAPTGIGVLYGKKSVLDEMPPYQSGGNMIADVSFEEIRYQPPPFKFEAGTGNIADAAGLGAALAWLSKWGLEAVAAHEHALIENTIRQLRPISGVKIIGNPMQRAGVVSFIIDGLKTQDVGVALSREGIAVRSGHHCAQPILRRFGLEASVRPSFAIYNTHADIDALARAVWKIKSGL